MFAAIREALRDRARRLAEAARLPDASATSSAFVRDRAGLAAPRPSRAAAAPARRARCRGGCAAAGRGCRSGARRRRRATVSRSGCSRSSREQTGYPPDMLDLDLDLEADLGIDTVKQAEVFATIREALRDRARRLAEAARLPDASTTSSGSSATAPGSPRPPPSPAPAAEPVRSARAPSPGSDPRRRSRSAERFPRRVPVAVLRPPLERCVADRRRRWARAAGSSLMPDRGGVGAALAQRLGKLGVEVLTIDGRAARRRTLETLLDSWAAGGPIDGVYWLPALDAEGPVRRARPGRAGARRCAPASSCSRATMRALSDHVGGPGRSSSSATRLGGRHGYDAAGATSRAGRRGHRLHQGLHARAARRAGEGRRLRPSAQDRGASPTLLVAGDAARPRRRRGRLRRRAALDGRPGRAPAGRRPRARARGPDTVFVSPAPPAASSRRSPPTSPRASGGTFHLLDLVARARPGRPRPRAASPTDRDGLKRELLERHAGARRAGHAGARRARAGRGSSALARRWPRSTRSRAPAARRTGTTRRPDRRARRSAAVVGDVARTARPHRRAASTPPGSRSATSCPTSRQREFDLVFDVKADGWFNLLHALGDVPLGAAVVFSSIAGRFGNGGQTDYSAANDLLCKSVVEPAPDSRPARRGIAIDWTAWADIGMATPRLDPEDDGGGRHRHAARPRSASRSSAAS